MAFDISSVLGDLSRTAQPPAGEQIEQIELHLIDSNPKNYYSMEGIDSLADNIRMFGLMDPLRVKRTDSGRYTVISGHRRREALRKIAEDGSTWPDGMHHRVSCIVEPDAAPVPGIDDPEKAAMARVLAEELKLIFANSDTRVMSSADQATQVRKIRELLAGLKDLGYPLPGKLREHVAAAAGISTSRVARLDVISKGLKIPQLTNAWKAGRLQETSAYEIARRSLDVQRLVFTRVGLQALCGMKTADVIECLDACECDGNRKPPEKPAAAKDETETDISEPDKAETVVSASDTGSQQEHSENHTVLPDSYLAYREQSSMEDAILQDICRRNITDILGCVMAHKDHNFSENFRQHNIDAMKKHGLSWCPSWYGHGESLDWDSKGIRVEKKTETPDGFKWIRFKRSWPDLYDALCGAALEQARKEKKGRKNRSVEKDEKVSAADTETAPAAVWSTGEPKSNGRYLCAVLIGDDLKPHEQRMEWKDGKWYVFGDPADKYEMSISKWWPLPPEVYR